MKNNLLAKERGNDLLKGKNEFSKHPYLKTTPTAHRRVLFRG